MLEAYRQHVAEREAEGIPPLPMDAEQTAQLVELIKTHRRAKRILCWICLLTVCRRALTRRLT